MIIVIGCMLLAMVLIGLAIVLAISLGCRVLLLVAGLLLIGVAAMQATSDSEKIHKPPTAIDLTGMLSSRPKPSLGERIVRWLDGE